MKNKKYFMILPIIVLPLLLVATTYLISQFFDRHRLVWQKPILIQTPVYIEERKVELISPEVKEVVKKDKPIKLSELSLRARTHYVKHTFIGDKLLEAFGDIKIIELVSLESSLDMRAVNSKSGACGLFQANPCEKMNCDLDDLDCQIEWGKKYITERYGSVENAIKFWEQHGYY